jgi:hypothetical protein
MVASPVPHHGQALMPLQLNHYQDLIRGYNRNPSPYEGQQIEIHIGSEIKTFKKWSLTPIQKTRLICVTALALSLISGVGCLLAASWYAKYELLSFVAIPLFGITLYAAYKWYHLRPDFDLPHVRKFHINRITTSFFTDIADSYKKEEVIGYNLFGRVNKDNQTLALYSKVKDLWTKYNALKARKAKDERWVLDRYYQVTSGPRAERELARRRNDDIRMAANVGAGLVHGRDKPRKNPDLLDYSAAIGKGVAHAHANNRDMEAEIKFREDTQYASQWKTDELNSIQGAFRDACVQIDTWFGNFSINPQFVITPPADQPQSPLLAPSAPPAYTPD